MKRWLGAVTIAATMAVLLWACGSGSTSTPSAPSTPTLSSVGVTGTTPAIGASSQFTATANLSNGTNQNVTNQAAWQSSSTSVATTSSSGLVTAVGAGEADIRATYQNVAGTLHISVAAWVRATARCSDGSYRGSQNRSGTCSSHGGVSCWICPGKLC